MVDNLPVNTNIYIQAKRTKGAQGSNGHCLAVHAQKQLGDKRDGDSWYVMAHADGGKRSSFQLQRGNGGYMIFNTKDFRDTAGHFGIHYIHDKDAYRGNRRDIGFFLMCHDSHKRKGVFKFLPSGDGYVLQVVTGPCIHVEKHFLLVTDLERDSESMWLATTDDVKEATIFGIGVEDRPAKRGRYQDMITVFHQCDEDAAIKIKNSWTLKPGDAGALGGACYFATTIKDTDRKAHKKGWIVQARVDMGRSKVTQEWDRSLTAAKLQAEGLDTVYMIGEGLTDATGAEVVVYDPSRIYVVDVKKREKWDGL